MLKKYLLIIILLLVTTNAFAQWSPYYKNKYHFNANIFTTESFQCCILNGATVELCGVNDSEDAFMFIYTNEVSECFCDLIVDIDNQVSDRKLYYIVHFGKTKARVSYANGNIAIDDYLIADVDGKVCKSTSPTTDNVIGKALEARISGTHAVGSEFDIKVLRK